jgi:hypothetical protein
MLLVQCFLFYKVNTVVLYKEVRYEDLDFC